MWMVAIELLACQYLRPCVHGQMGQTQSNRTHTQFCTAPSLAVAATMTTATPRILPFYALINLRNEFFTCSSVIKSMKMLLSFMKRAIRLVQHHSSEVGSGGVGYVFTGDQRYCNIIVCSPPPWDQGGERFLGNFPPGGGTSFLKKQGGDNFRGWKAYFQITWWRNRAKIKN